MAKKAREESGAGKWAGCYKDGQGRKIYGRKTSYRRAARWLSPCREVEDWGCGCCEFRRVLARVTAEENLMEPIYTGIDGTPGYCHRVEDLEKYTTTVSGINMRHVLEHNVNWRQILANALESYQDRMVLVLFLTMADGDEDIPLHDDTFDDGQTVIPNIRLCKRDVYKMLEGHIHHVDQYRKETIFYLERP